jgi:predicted ester cyclase
VSLGDHAQVDRQRDIARRWFTEGWAGDVGLADLIFDPAFMGNGVEIGPQGPRRHVLSRLAGFPDLETDIEDLISSGDHVVIRLQWSGTHRGPYGGVAATGRHVELGAMVLWRFRDGKVVEDWTIQDWLSYLHQVGAIPADQFRNGPEPQP